jgi:hypothetical protein
MALRALMALGLSALLNIAYATFGHSAPLAAWRQCWVTETGVGVCVPSQPVSSRRQRVFIARRQ